MLKLLHLDGLKAFILFNNGSSLKIVHLNYSVTCGMLRGKPMLKWLQQLKSVEDSCLIVFNV